MVNYQVVDMERHVVKIIDDYMVSYEGKKITLEDYLAIKEQMLENGTETVNKVIKNKGKIIYLRFS